MHNLSRPLSMGPAIWMLLAVVALLAITQQKSEHDPADFRPLRIDNVDRKADGTIVFAELGIAVDLNNGWTWLSYDDDGSTMQPTLIHLGDKLIANIQPFPFRQWPPEDLPSDDVQTQNQSFAKVTIQWLAESEEYARDQTLRGRVLLDEGDLLLTLSLVASESKPSPAVAQLCDAITPLDFQ